MFPVTCKWWRWILTLISLQMFSEKFDVASTSYSNSESGKSINLG